MTESSNVNFSFLPTRSTSGARESNLEVNSSTAAFDSVTMNICSPALYVLSPIYWCIKPSASATSPNSTRLCHLLFIHISFFRLILGHFTDGLSFIGPEYVRALEKWVSSQYAVLHGSSSQDSMRRATRSRNFSRSACARHKASRGNCARMVGKYKTSPS